MNQNDSICSCVKPSHQVPQWRQRLPLSLWIHGRGHQIWVVIILFTNFWHRGKYLQKIRQYFKVRERSVFLLSLWLSRPAEVPKMVLHHCSKVLICVFSCTIIFLILTVYALVWHSWSWCVAWFAGAAPLQGGIYNGNDCKLRWVFVYK